MRIESRFLLPVSIPTRSAVLSRTFWAPCRSCCGRKTRLCRISDRASSCGGYHQNSDNPGGAALVISVARGREHERIPSVVEGLRTVCASRARSAHRIAMRLNKERARGLRHLGQTPRGCGENPKIFAPHRAAEIGLFQSAALFVVSFFAQSLLGVSWF